MATTNKGVSAGISLASKGSTAWIGGLVYERLTRTTIWTWNIISLAKAARVHWTMALERIWVVRKVRLIATVARNVVGVELIVANSIITVTIVAIIGISSLFLLNIVTMVAVENWLK